MPRATGRGYGRGMAAMGYAPYGYAPNHGLVDRLRSWFYGGYGYGAGYGMGYGRARGFGRGRGIGASLGYCPYTGMPRGWRWYGYGTPQYNHAGYPYAQPYTYRRDGE